MGSLGVYIEYPDVAAWLEARMADEQTVEQHLWDTVVALRMMPGCVVPDDVTEDDLAADMTELVEFFAKRHGLDAEGVARALQKRVRS